MPSVSTAHRPATRRPTNGAAVAAILSAAVGASAVGFFAVANEMGIFASPALYVPAGGLSGRTTLAAATWLIAWLFLHWRWKNRELEPRRVFTAALVLIAAGILATFPPVWWLF
jgi:hypothetical protein